MKEWCLIKEAKPREYYDRVDIIANSVGKKRATAILFAKQG